MPINKIPAANDDNIWKDFLDTKKLLSYANMVKITFAWRAKLNTDITSPWLMSNLVNNFIKEDPSWETTRASFFEPKKKMPGN